MPASSECLCPRPDRIHDPELHASFHQLVIEQGGPAGLVNIETTAAARGIKPAHVARHAPRQPNLYEWRRIAWGVIRTAAISGDRFTTEQIIRLVPPAPDGDTGIHVEALLITASTERLLLTHHPTGEWQSRDRSMTTTGIAHPPTSQAAAATALPESGTKRRAVLDAIRSHREGLTDPELQHLLTMPANTQRPRRVELVEQGLVRDSGRTRIIGGNEHTVWVRA